MANFFYLSWSFGVKKQKKIKQRHGKFPQANFKSRRKLVHVSWKVLKLKFLKDSCRSIKIFFSFEILRIFTTVLAAHNIVDVMEINVDVYRFCVTIIILSSSD